jgi:hypothetical protein
MLYSTLVRELAERLRIVAQQTGDGRCRGLDPLGQRVHILVCDLRARSGYADRPDYVAVVIENGHTDATISDFVLFVVDGVASLGCNREIRLQPLFVRQSVFVVAREGAFAQNFIQPLLRKVSDDRLSNPVQ